jgi:hypothetical protein
MRSKLFSFGDLPVSRVGHLLQGAGVVSVISGLIGGFIWLADLHDRSDGDSLRYGFWHNPFMQFPPFSEPFLEASMSILFWCSAAAGLGGLMLLVPKKWGIPLVTLQARVSIVTNSVIAFFIVGSMFVFSKNQWAEWHLGGTVTALVLRLGSVAIDLLLWGFLSSHAVRDWRPESPARGFEVVLEEADRGMEGALSHSPAAILPQGKGSESAALGE